MKILAKSIGLVLLALLIAACAIPSSSSRASPNLDQKRSLIKAVVILPPTVHVETLSAGGVHEEQEEWSMQAEKNVMTAVEEQLKGRSGLHIEYLPKDSLSKEIESNLTETQALFDAVSTSVVIHTYGPEPARFPEKISNFDYSLGPEVNKLAGPADALLVIRAEDHISTEGRKSLQVAGMIIGALAGVVMVPVGGTTVASAALVDARSGSLLWYNLTGSQGGYDLRDSNSANELVKRLLADFPVK